MTLVRHLEWIPAGAAVGFLASFVFGDLLPLPTDLYFVLYFAVVLGFLAWYVRRTGLDLHAWTSRRLGWGLALGLLGGLLLLAFPWVVVWRAFGAEEGGWRRKTTAGLAAWVAVLLLTTAYHLGYGDFRSKKILQPNVGSTIGAAPTLVTANPVAATVSHVVLHVTAVIHDPDTDLYLPPHRRQ